VIVPAQRASHLHAVPPRERRQRRAAVSGRPAGQPLAQRAARAQLQHEAALRPVGGEGEEAADVLVGDLGEQRAAGAKMRKARARRGTEGTQTRGEGRRDGGREGGREGGGQGGAGRARVELEARATEGKCCYRQVLNTVDCARLHPQSAAAGAHIRTHLSLSNCLASHSTAAALSSLTATATPKSVQRNTAQEAPPPTCFCVWQVR
jgi:hypothetical protein